MQRRNTRGRAKQGFAGRTPVKAKTPWGTIFLTAVVAGAGTYATMQLMMAAQKKAQERDGSARDLLFNPAPVSAEAIAPRALANDQLVLVSRTALEHLHNTSVH